MLNRQISKLARLISASRHTSQLPNSNPPFPTNTRLITYEARTAVPPCHNFHTKCMKYELIRENVISKLSRTTGIQMLFNIITRWTQCQLVHRRLSKLGQLVATMQSRAKLRHTGAFNEIGRILRPTTSCAHYFQDYEYVAQHQN